MTDTPQSADRLSALALILLSLYWVWASAWPPVAVTGHDLVNSGTLAGQYE